MVQGKWETHIFDIKLIIYIYRERDLSTLLACLAKRS